MEQQQVQFKNPPVVETVISAQFAPLDNLNVAHIGIFWHEMLSILPEWGDASLVEAQRIEDVIEELSEGPSFQTLGVTVKETPPDMRLQIKRSDEERMMQIQNTRFVYNWRRRTAGEYPSFAATFSEFSKYYSMFGQHLSKRKLGELQPNQWEVTYVNHIPKGTLWDKVDDWATILPGLFTPTGHGSGEVAFETMSGGWKYRLDKDRGRLHVVLQHALTQEKDEILSLRFIARGPVDVTQGCKLESGVEIGHQAIIQTFDSIVSDEARQFWNT